MTREPDALPESITLYLEKAEDLRYGENPHQGGARYRMGWGGGEASGDWGAEESENMASWFDTAEIHNGKQLSYLNLNDAEAAWGLVCAFGVQQAAAVVVKHANPCGVALSDTALSAWEKAHSCDPVSAFGGVVAVNQMVEADLAEAMTQNFLEVVIAPGYSDAALEVFAKKKNLRILEASQPPSPCFQFRSLGSAMLVQEVSALPSFADLVVSLGEPGADDASEVVSDRSPTPAELADLAFAWTVVAATQSNAIVFARDLQAVGIGAGQQNRKDASFLAARKAGDRAVGSVCASDAFFPFRDGLDQAGEAGCTAVIQPGGSIRDEEVIQAANEHNMAMIFTHQRRFRH